MQTSGAYARHLLHRSWDATVTTAAAVTLSAALFLIRTDNPTTNDRACTLSASLHNALVRPVVSPLTDERDWLTHGLPDLRGPTDAAGGCGLT